MTTIADFRNKWQESIDEQEKGNNNRRDSLRSEAKILAKNYAKENEERLTLLYGHLDESQLVKQVTFLRSQGRDEEVAELTMWIMSNFEPRTFSGAMGPRPKIIRAPRDGR